MGMKSELGGGRRYGLLQAAKDSEYVKKVYGGYLNVYVSAFGEEGERWDLFRVYDGEFPDFTELHKYDGFVVTGSAHDAYSNDYWVLKLCFLLQTLDAMEKKLLGICFGHQVYIYHKLIKNMMHIFVNDTYILINLCEYYVMKVLCRALGGRVGKAYTGWDIGIRKVRIWKDLLGECRYIEEEEEGMPQSLSIIEIHQDEVYEIPEGARVIGSSEKTGVEVFGIGDHILGIQGHPEYTKDILLNLIDRLLNNHLIQVPT